MYKVTLVTVALLFSFSVFSADETINADKEAINTACAADAATANCGNKKVGTGLLKCLHAYKKGSRRFKFSEGCNSAMNKGQADKKAGK